MPPRQIAFKQHLPVVMVTLGLGCVALYFSLRPSGPAPASGVPWDKVMHMAGFAVLGFPLMWRRAAWWRGTVGALVLFGAMIEVIQPSFGRNAEWADLAADVAGIGLSYVAAALVRRRGTRV